ncbi:MAG TPA: two-component regulator propeller domain-containing protein [Williamwhitmania sp.]|nr:two-component regulator propeller domain-containing protein [Williamwhitmania sp.]
MQRGVLYRSLFTVLLCITAITANAQSKNHALQAELFTIDNGLSQSSVQCLFIDSKGFLWVGTQDGLNRYDGYSFKIYRNQPTDDRSIASNFIYSIREDTFGTLWIGTQAGLSSFSPVTDKFTNYRYTDGGSQSLASSIVYYVYVDHQNNVWAKTLETLDCLNPKTGKFLHYRHYNDPFNYSVGTNDFCILEDSKMNLWVGTKDGLNLFDRARRIFKRYYTKRGDKHSISNDRIKYIFEDSKGRLWVGTQFGLNLYNPESDNFKRFFPGNADPKSGNNVVNLIAETSKGELWLATDDGVGVFNPIQYTFNLYNKLVSSNQSFLSNTITSIVEDCSQNLWIGTLQGLVKIDNREPKFHKYSYNSKDEPLFGNNLVASIYDNGYGSLWVGTWGSGLYKLNRSTMAIEHFGAMRSGGIPNNFVHAICKTSWGDLLIGTRDGVAVYNESLHQMEDFFSYYHLPSKSVFKGNRVYQINEDSMGNLWFATSFGLYRFNGQRVDRVDKQGRESLLFTSSDIRALASDRDGNLWVGTSNGLNRYSTTDGKVIRFLRPTPFKGDGIINNEIVSLYLDSRGLLWVGTISGLSEFNTSSGVFKQYTERDGLPNGLVYAIEEDGWGNIWLSTNRGIAKIDPESGKVFKFDILDGLQSYEFNVGACYKNKRGELFFGGINGLNYFFPDSIKISDVAPRMAFTACHIYTHKGVEEVPVQNFGTVNIPKGCNFFTVEFASLDFSKTSKNTYRYILDGFDNQWVDLGTENSVSFTNLQQGHYTLKVLAANNDGVWNMTGISLNVVIKTEFWGSALARWLYAILAIFVTILFILYRTRGLKETRRLLKERELAITEAQKQKEELFLKNKNITDSINYAKRIQEALMPSATSFSKIIPQSFILYQPKDIVSGDFFWINETENKIFVAVVDCTGHGVPGAFMSIIGFELLRNITTIQGVDDAAEILNRLNKGVIDTFSKDEQNVYVKDGMDVSFCVIDKTARRMQFAGAFSNMYIVRDNKIIEMKGDRFAVGLATSGNQQFSSETIDLEQEDRLYLFTDGYVDQFGGPEGKKYKFRRFRHLLLNIHREPMERQKAMLEESIVEWRNGYEQVDDILIMGINTGI